MAIKSDSKPTKARTLLEEGTLNPAPEKVHDPKFRDSEFFDPRDIVQVKYEMLRRVANDGYAVTRAAEAFGFSRPSFYQAQAAFRRDGLPGLAAHKRGPRQAHKLTPEVIDFLRREKQQDPSLRGPALARMVEQRFQTVVHPRSIERGLERSQKKTATPS